MRLQGLSVTAKRSSILLWQLLLMFTWISFAAGQIDRQRQMAVTQMQGPATTLNSGTQFPGSSNQVQAESKWPIFLEGKVVGEDGGAVWNASVLLQCGYKSQQIETKTGTNGFFDLQMSANNTGPDVCDLYVDAPMYTQLHMTVKLDPSLYGVTIGTIVLHSGNNFGEDRKSTISVLSLAAPPKAKEAFETGLKDGKKGKLAAACEHFRKAIQLYPRYALAWLELGRTQTLQGNVVEAQHSFEEAQAQDSHLLSAYVELTRLTAKQNQWLAVQHTTDRALQVASADSAPWFYFFNSFAKAQLGDLKGAEHSAYDGLRADVKHNVPSLEHLYGVILAKQRNYSEAIEHITTYLQLAPQASDAQLAQEQLTELNRIMEKR
jgi:TolA-binding protein